MLGKTLVWQERESRMMILHFHLKQSTKTLDCNVLSHIRFLIFALWKSLMNCIQPRINNICVQKLQQQSGFQLTSVSIKTIMKRSYKSRI